MITENGEYRKKAQHQSLVPKGFHGTNQQTNQGIKKKK